MENEDTKTVLATRLDDAEESEEDVDTASRWIPVALKLAMANSDEEARP